MTGISPTPRFCLSPMSLCGATGHNG
jgi:hypothetical protein